MRYYEVEAKCGHVGRNYYVIKKFYVRANDGKEAALLVRKKPRVKHHKKDAIKSVTQISYEQYIDGIKEIKNDLYFQVHSSTEQRRVVEFEDGEIKKEETQLLRRKVEHIKQRIISTLLEKEWRRERGLLYE